MSKKVFIVVVALLFSIATTFAQSNLHVQQFATSTEGNHQSTTKLMYEGTKLTDNSVTYALFSGDFSDKSDNNLYYAQIFHEQKFWDAPVYIHTEFRTYNFYQNVVYLGGAFTFATEHGMIAIEPLVRNDFFGRPYTKTWKWDRTGGQLSLVSGHDWGFMNLNTFTDIYNTGGTIDMNWYTEVWLYFPVTQNLQLGSITSFSSSYPDEFTGRTNILTFFLGLKINF